MYFSRQYYTTRAINILHYWRIHTDIHSPHMEITYEHNNPRQSPADYIFSAFSLKLRKINKVQCVNEVRTITCLIVTSHSRKVPTLWCFFCTNLKRTHIAYMFVTTIDIYLSSIYKHTNEAKPKPLDNTPPAFSQVEQSLMFQYIKCFMRISRTIALYHPE